jgi:hypothetical protein
MPILESKLIINASDETQAAFASVMARITELQARLSSVNGSIGKFTPPSQATLSATATAAAAMPSRATLSATATAAAVARAAPAPSPRPPEQGAGEGFWETVGGAIATITGYKAFHAGYEEAMAQQHERVRQELAAMSADEIAKGEQLGAQLAAKYPAVPQSEIMHSIRTARTVTGSFDEATGVAEPLTQLRVIAQAANPKASTEDMQEEFDKLVKALEIAGVATDPKRLQSYTNDIAKSLNAFGDQLKPTDYFDMLRYGRQASSKISERFLMTTLATLGTEFGGSNIGTALSGFNQATVGNRFTHTAAMGFVDMGLIPDESLALTKTGEIKGIKPGGHVKDWQLAQTDPDLWIKQDLLPALEAKGITSSDEIAARIGQLFSNRNAANLVTQIALQQQKLEKNATLWSDAQGLRATDLLGSKDATTAFSGVGNAVTRFIAQQFDTDIYGQIGAAVTKAFGSLTPAPMPHTDLGADAATDLKGWADFFRSIKIGGPETSEQWHADMRAAKSLWDADYRSDDLDQEMARERARGFSASPLIVADRPELESARETARANALSPNLWDMRTRQLTPPEERAPSTQEINVSGQAQVDHVVHLEVTLDPELRAEIRQATDSQSFTVPLIGGGNGRMDSDASPHRTGGIGHM